MAKIYVNRYAENALHSEADVEAAKKRLAASHPGFRIRVTKRSWSISRGDGKPNWTVAAIQSERNRAERMLLDLANENERKPYDP